MKILLIEPPKSPVTIGGEDVFVFEPLALEYLAAGVADDHDVQILDMRFEPDLEPVLETFQPEIVGITAYTVHVPVVQCLFDRIKKWNPKVLTVVGGHHATVVPEDFLRGSIDLVVLGEGVFAFQQIVAAFEKKTGFEDITGIAYPRNGELVHSEAPPAPDLDALPVPRRNLTAKYRKRYFCEWMQPLASIRTSKGCPHRCTFCALWKLAGGKYFRRDPQKIVEELAAIEEKYVFFADDESLVDAARMKTLARLIKEAGIRKEYFLYGRSDTIANNADLLEMWAEIGLKRVFVGLEFSRDEDLRAIGKGSTTDDNRQAVRILLERGIEVYASFIVRPDFTHADFDDLRRYCHELGLSFAMFAVLTPLPGTDFYTEVRSQLVTGDYAFFDFVHTLLPTTLSLQEFYSEYASLYAKAIPFSKSLVFISKFPLRKIPGLFVKVAQWQKKLKAVYQDYQET